MELAIYRILGEEWDRPSLHQSPTEPIQGVQWTLRPKLGSRHEAHSYLDSHTPPCCSPLIPSRIAEVLELLTSCCDSVAVGLWADKWAEMCRAINPAQCETVWLLYQTSG